MADSDTISGIENLKSAVSGETPAYQYKDPNTDMMKAISKCIDAADGTIDDQYEYKNPNTDVIRKMDELADAITEGGGSHIVYEDISDFSFYYKINMYNPTITKISNEEFQFVGQVYSDSGYELCSFSIPLSKGIYIAEMYITLNKNTGLKTDQYGWGLYSTDSSEWARSNGNSVFENRGVDTYVAFDTSDTQEHLYSLPIMMRTDGIGYICFAMAADDYNNTIFNCRSLKIRKVS